MFTKSIKGRNKYDYHSFVQNAPLGTSIFALNSEKEFAANNFAVLTEKYFA
jgi:hypothetical protein